MKCYTIVFEYTWFVFVDVEIYMEHLVHHLICHTYNHNRYITIHTNISKSLCYDITISGTSDTKAAHVWLHVLLQPILLLA